MNLYAWELPACSFPKRPHERTLNIFLETFLLPRITPKTVAATFTPANVPRMAAGGGHWRFVEARGVIAQDQGIRSSREGADILK